MRIALKDDNFKKLDKSDMLSVLLDFPEQCKAAVDIARKAKILFEKRDFNKVVFVGLGASAIGADLARSYLYSESKIPILVVREYELPAYVDNSTLVVICSYSGNTEETLSAYQQAKQKQATLIAISAGGKLKDYACSDSITFVEIPQGLPPRSALGYLSIIPLCVLSKLGIAGDHALSINAAIKVLEELKEKSLSPRIPEKDNIAKTVAAALLNRYAIIYSSSIHFDIPALRLREQIAENSKTLSSSYLFPEMNHNEIVGWQNPVKVLKNFTLVMLRDKLMHPRITKRMDITEEILRKDGVRIIEVWSRGQDLLSRIFSLIYIGDFISYYLAILYGIDPTPVDRITYLKKELGKD